MFIGPWRGCLDVAIDFPRAPPSQPAHFAQIDRPSM